MRCRTGNHLYGNGGRETACIHIILQSRCVEREMKMGLISHGEPQRWCCLVKMMDCLSRRWRLYWRDGMGASTVLEMSTDTVHVKYREDLKCKKLILWFNFSLLPNTCCHVLFESIHSMWFGPYYPVCSSNKDWYIDWLIVVVWKWFGALK